MDTENPNLLLVADLVIDKEKYTLTQNEIEINITKKELKILYLLAKNSHEVQSREAIFRYAWEEGVLVGSRTIDVHIRRLRAKIGETYIRTVKGIGYQFVE